MSALSFLLLLPWACTDDGPRAAPAIEARLELAAGDVRSGDHPVYTGAALGRSATLTTGAGARAEARLSDGSAVFLRENSALALVDGGISLTAGEVFVEAPDTTGDAVEHHVGEVVISAVDAGFSVRVDDGRTRVFVARGSAVLTAPGGRVELAAGIAADVVDGKPVTSPVAYWDDWTGGLADHRVLADLSGAATGRLYGVRYGDSPSAPGTAAAALETRGQSVHATIRSGLAETEVDQTFFNPGDTPLEGWYWFTVPEGAVVTGFAVETNGALVEGEFVEKSRAAAGYGRGVASGFQPALLEWVDERTARARIYPVPAMGSRRVVLRYLQELPVADGTFRYVYPLRSDDPTAIGEFGLTVDLGTEGRSMRLATSADARVEDGGERVTVRRSGYVPRADFLLEATLDDEPAPVRVSRFRTDESSADYVMLRYTPDLSWADAGVQSADVVVVVDTSAGADEASRRLEIASVEAVLRALSAEDRFALVAVDIGARVLHPATGLAPATDEGISAALERLSEHAHGGATDLSASFDTALGLLHDGVHPAVVYIGDGIATSGERSGAALREQLRQALVTSEARVFTVAIGSHADPVLLAELARTGGGLALRVEDSVEATEQALRLAAAIKTPTATDLHVDLGAGLDELYESSGGKVSLGEEVVVLARTHHPLPDQVRISGRLGDKEFVQTYPLTADDPLVASFVPKLWAKASVDRLLGGGTDREQLRGTVARIGVEYGLLTPYSSLLALDSDQAYAALGIPRGGTYRGLHLGALSREQEASIRSNLVFGPLGCRGADEPPMAAQNAGPNGAERAQFEDLGGAVTSPIVAEPTSDPAVSGVLALAKSSAREVDLLTARDEPEPVEEEVAAHFRRKVDDGERQENKPENARIVVTGTACSDVASRPLADRVAMWRRRLDSAADPQALLATIQTARASCELADWRAESTLLELVANRIGSEGDARTVLAGLADAARHHLGRTLLRRATDPRITLAVEELVFRGGVDWVAVDRRVAEARTPADRVRILREAVAAAPDDPRGTIRLLRALATAGDRAELLVQVHGLQDRGVVTAEMAREIGDLLAADGHADEAIRAYSEIVEFGADDPNARRQLGDIYLAHGWYDQAYRQYQAIDRPDAVSSLRLAIAAGGAGRVAEALRLQRAVAATAGIPGSDDPRTWARLWSASRIARLLGRPDGTEADAERTRDSLRRDLKEQQFFRAPGTLVIVTWEDLGADVALRTWRDGHLVAAGDGMDGAAVGVAGVILTPADAEGLALKAELRTPAADRPLRLTRDRIRFDGTGFVFDTAVIEVPAGATSIAL